MRTYYVTVNGRELTVRLGTDGTVSLDGREKPHEVKRVSPTEFSVMIGNRQVRVVASAGEAGIDVIAGGFRGTVSVESERDRLLRLYSRSTVTSGARLEVHAPMPAMVIKLEVSIGDEIRTGQPLLVLEAMKMENEILAPGPGRVKAIHAKAGKPVEKGELLLLLE
jgi:biotin carboxyl carrier protein